MFNLNNHGGYRPGAGRPKLDATRKNHSMKFTDTEWQQLEELAIKNGCITKAGKPNVTEYIRQVALKLK